MNISFTSKKCKECLFSSYKPKKMKLIRISLSKLLKLEVPELMNDVICAVEKHNPQLLQLEGILQLLKYNKTQADTLKVPYGAHPLTSKVHELHQLRLEYAGSISTQIQAAVRVPIMASRPEMIIVNDLVRNYLLGLRNNNQHVVSNLLSSFFKGIDANAQIEDAFKQVGLQLYVDELRKADVAYKKTYNERGNSLAKRQRAKMNKSVQKNVQAVLRSFFDHLELSQMTYTQLNYKPLISLLNTILIDYSALIKTRAAYNKKRTKAANVDTETIVPEKHILCVNGEETGSVMIRQQEKEERDTIKVQIKKGVDAKLKNNGKLKVDPSTPLRDRPSTPLRSVN